MTAIIANPDGKNAPASDLAPWDLDPAHTAAEFAVRHLMVTTVRGELRITSGVLHADESDPARSRVEVAIDARSISTGVGDRDAHLKSADFLDVENHPTITFRSTRIERRDGDSGRLYGDLTIRGVTREVALDATFEGKIKGTDGEERAGFSATTTIDRRDWGLTWNVALEAGGVLVGEKIKISLSVSAVKRQA